MMESISIIKPATKNKIDRILKNIRMDLIIPLENCFFMPFTAVRHEDEK
ncbi:hypothetical protein X474_18325 [Dethiosulfatarculus sandiegensis]|uniref:Uncharacterized protein n=1 Tax=Dethiosulfatarculus sandiegensis TaxID=1429043 RepID=A0A0D2JA42_9BACT|nr:hypothetical protein X474_18325 [Dethiosulfatarculus sandiegensis]